MSDAHEAMARAAAEAREPMKRSDIDDAHVVDLARRWRDGWRGGPRCAGVVDALVAEGVPRKLATAKVEHLSRHGGPLEYGVSPNYAWPVDDEAAR